MKTFIVSMMIIGFGIFGITNCANNGFLPNYSIGQRTGTVSKFSQKGIFIKTWEGEMILGGLRNNPNGGVEANIWEFTCQNDDLIPIIEEAQQSGQRVTISYKQYLLRPLWIDSRYIVESVK